MKCNVIVQRTQVASLPPPPTQPLPAQPEEQPNQPLQRKGSNKLKKNPKNRESNRFSFLNVLTAAKEPPRSNSYDNLKYYDTNNNQKDPIKQPDGLLPPSEQFLRPPSPQQHPQHPQHRSLPQLHSQPSNGYLGPDVTQQPLTPAPTIPSKAPSTPWYTNLETRLETKNELKTLMEGFLNKLSVTMNSFEQDAHLESLANLTKSQTSLAMHEAVCDGCNNRIQGVRMKCTTCRDYDLCVGCFSVGTHDHETFHRICDPSKPLPSVPKSIDTNTPLLSTNTSVRSSHSKQNAHHSANCDMCKSGIIGTRHKCTICPDYVSYPVTIGYYLLKIPLGRL